MLFMQRERAAILVFDLLYTHHYIFDFTDQYAHLNTERSSGTVLPLPALYRFAPPVNSLGFGSWSSD